MTSNLEKAKNKLQLNKLKLAREEFEVKILEYLGRIEHFKSQIEIQNKAIEDLEKRSGSNYGRSSDGITN